MIRAFQPSDTDEVNALVLRAFIQYQGAYDDWPRFSLAFERLAAGAEQSEVVVAEQEGRIVGAVGYVGADQPKPDFYQPDWTMIRMLVVDPAHRGRGIGRALADECLHRAQRDGAPLIALHTSPIMEVALAMYQRMGFVLEKELAPIFGVPYGMYIKRLDSAD